MAFCQFVVKNLFEGNSTIVNYEEKVETYSAQWSFSFYFDVEAALSG